MLTGVGDPEAASVGARLEHAGHDLQVVPAKTPAHSQVWECQDCAKRRTHAAHYTSAECDGGDGS
jgi:hypothetical protein